MSHITPSKPTPPPPRTPRTNPHPNPPFPLRTTTHVNILPSSPQTLATPPQPPYRLKVMAENRLRWRKPPNHSEDTTTTLHKIPWMHLTTTPQKIPWTYLTQPVVKTVYIDFDLLDRDAALEVPWEVYKKSFDSEHAVNNPDKKIKWKGDRLILYH
ncbi:hypothetical protein TWF703_006132 [Orbilia oligospora]|uniref:Uncharacterized protein n=1 Tax=Orbilia oligospora TaxID=2813651 RepID=A0A7C8JVW3_ORBOL|nr:hypothetical protein TWF703_006132 [Orbilia oligospora]